MNVIISVNILFSLLFIRWDVSPYLLHIGHFAVRWYSFLFYAGFALGSLIFAKIFNDEKLPIKLLDPLILIVWLLAIVGARLGHIIFYEPHYYFVEHPEEILKVWHGGLASHGGAIAILFGVWWYVKKYGKKYHFDFLWVMDRLAIAVPFAGMFIRLGNLMNSEIYGVTTSLPWGFIFERNGELMPKHPTQLYEALSYCLIGVIMVLIYCYAHKKVHRGFLFGLFLTLLFAARFFIEFVKEPQEAFENNMSLDMGQWLSIPFILVGLFFLIRSFYIKTPTRIYPVETPAVK